MKAFNRITRLAYRWYDADKVVAGKTMKDHLRFACAYWHSFCGTGADPFGGPTHVFPWDEKADAVERAKDKMDAAFEFITKLICHTTVSTIWTWLTIPMM
jgi:xylose isomerase